MDKSHFFMVEVTIFPLKKAISFDQALDSCPGYATLAEQKMATETCHPSGPDGVGDVFHKGK